MFHSIHFITKSLYSVLHSFLFDGTDKHFDSIDHEKINPTTTGTSKSYTYLLSIKRNDILNSIAYGNYNGSNFSTKLQFNGGEIQYINMDSGVSKVLSTNSSFTSITDWYHIAYVIDGESVSNSRIYVNGVDETLTNTLTYNSDAIGNAYHIGDSGDKTLHANIYFSGISLINNALTSTQVSEWYNNGKPLNPSVLHDSNCVMNLNADNSGDTAQFTITDSVNSITATSNNMETVDKTTETPY